MTDKEYRLVKRSLDRMEKELKFSESRFKRLLANKESECVELLREINEVLKPKIAELTLSLENLSNVNEVKDDEIPENLSNVNEVKYETPKNFQLDYMFPRSSPVLITSKFSNSSSFNSYKSYKSIQDEEENGFDSSFNVLYKPGSSVKEGGAGLERKRVKKRKREIVDESESVDEDEPPKKKEKKAPVNRGCLPRAFKKFLKNRYSARKSFKAQKAQDKFTKVVKREGEDSNSADLRSCYQIYSECGNGDNKWHAKLRTVLNNMEKGEKIFRKSKKGDPIKFKLE
jgi:hypothetical protein